MFRNYFTIGWRNLLRNKGYSAINIGGLAAGMAATILIGLWIFDEISFNRSFENYDRIGHVMVHNGEGTYPSNPLPLEAELRTNYAQDFKYVTLSDWTQEYPITSGDRKFMESGSFMQADAAEIFSLDMISGTRKALSQPNTIVIAESLSKKLFGDEDPVNEIVRIKNIVDVRVGGVFKDFAPNTDLYKTNFIGSWDCLLSWMSWIKEEQDRWDNNSFKIYVQLNDGVTFENASAKIKDIKLKYLNEERRQYKPELFVHRMSNWHLYSKFKDRQIVMSEQLQFVWLYGTIGGFVLILACINFMNLSTARSEKRAKEVGIRKTMGSLRKQLVVQFFSESFITVMIAAVCGICVVIAALPFFNEIAAKQITIPWSIPTFWIVIVSFVFFAGLLAGSYPAFYLSGLKPVKSIVHITSLPRKILVVLQFTVSVSLILGTTIVYQQIEYARNRPVGYTRDGLVTVYMTTPELNEHAEALRNEMLLSGAVENVATASAPVTGVWSNNSGFDWDGKPATLETNFNVNWVTQPYGKTVGWQFIRGSDFTDGLVADGSSIVINRTLADMMGFDDPVGQILRWEELRLKIVGVVEDMVMGSPYQPILPTVFRLGNRNLKTINIRLNPSWSAQEAIQKIAPIFQKYNPSAPFEYKFVDEQYNKKFASEIRVGKLASIFSGLAILISLLGLLGLSSFVAEQRTKEIGIRKVVGATVVNVWMLLTRNFVMLVLISCVVALPLSSYVLNNWLTKFDYRITIQWWIFPAVIVGTVVLTLATVSYQAIRAALMNPVKSLRSE